MTVDEILADPIEALDLPEGSIPVGVVLLVEYANPGSDAWPTARRLAMMTDDNMPPWTAIGMMRFAQQREYDAVGDATDDPD